MIKFKSEKDIPFQFFNRENGHCFDAQIIARCKVYGAALCIDFASSYLAWGYRIPLHEGDLLPDAPEYG